MNLKDDLSKILIIDFGSQFTQLIARRVREIGVYCELVPYDVNIHYSLFGNFMNIPIGILQEPFLTDNKIFNSAGLGSIICHEIVHSFDILGKNYDNKNKEYTIVNNNDELFLSIISNFKITNKLKYKIEIDIKKQQQLKKQNELDFFIYNISKKMTQIKDYDNPKLLFLICFLTILGVENL